MIALAVDTFEGVRARLTLFGFEVQRINLEVGLTTPDKVAVVFNFVRAVTFQASCTLKLTCEGVTCEGGVTPLPTILVLWDTRVHIGLSDSYNITADVEALVDKFLGSQAVL